MQPQYSYLPTNMHNKALYDKVTNFRNTNHTNHIPNHWKPHKHLKTNPQRNHFSRRHILYPMQRLQQTLHRWNQTQLRKKIYEHNRSIKTNDDRNALFSELKHIFNFSEATLIKPIPCKKSRWLLESAVISKANYIWQHPGFYQILPYLANIINHESK